MNCYAGVRWPCNVMSVSNLHKVWIQRNLIWLMEFSLEAIIAKKKVRGEKWNFFLFVKGFIFFSLHQQQRINATLMTFVIYITYHKFSFSLIMLAACKICCGNFIWWFIDIVEFNFLDFVLFIHDINYFTIIML